MNDRPSPGVKIFDWYFVAAILSAAVLLLVTILLPLGFDNDVYQSMGWTLWAYHGLPYIASWDMNFPGIVFIHAASIALFGSSDFGFRMFDYLTHIAIAGMLYVLLHRWLRPFTSFIAIIIWTLYYTGGLWGLAGQRDGFAVFFLLVASLLLFSLHDNVTSSIRALTLGAVCACAVLIRPTYGIFLLSFLWLVWSLPNRARLSTYFIVGAATIIFGFLLPYLFIQEGIEQIYYSVIRFNLDVYTHIPVQISFFFRRNGLIYALAIAGSCIMLIPGLAANVPLRDAKSLNEFDRKFFYSMLASSIISPVVMGKYFSYHLDPFLTIVTAFAAIGLVHLGEFQERIRLGLRPQWTIASITMVGVAILAAMLYPRHLIKYYIEAMGTVHPLASTYYRVDNNSFGIHAQEEVVRYVDSHTRPSDPIEYASVYAGLRWRLAHPSATRFTTLVPVVPPVSFHANYLDRWQREYINTLAIARPSYIILNSSQEHWPFTHSSVAQAPHLIPGFDSLLAADYTLDTVIQGFILYRPKA